MRRAGWGVGLVITLALLACKKEEAPAPTVAPPRSSSTLAPGTAAPPGEAPRLPMPPRRRPGADRVDGVEPTRDDRPDRDEIAARRDERRKEERAMYDTDQDGKLSPQERETMHESRVAGMVDHLDVDRDGKLTAAEYETAGASGGRGGRRGPVDFATADVDKDGFVTVEELAAATQMRGPRGRGRDERAEPPGGPAVAPPR